jgi:hypothetical protein
MEFSTAQLVVSIVVAFITGIAGPIAVFWFKKWYEGKNESKEEKELDITKSNIAFNTKITGQLKEVRDHIGADRVWVAEFHNGGKFLFSGESIQKFSVTYEVVSPGTSSEKEIFHDVLVSFFAQTIETISEAKEASFLSSEQIQNGELRALAKQRGNVAMYLYSMESIEGLLIGILGIDFVREEKQLSREERLYLENTTNLLAGYIENKDLASKIIKENS